MIAAARVGCRPERGKKEGHEEVSEGTKNEASRGRRFQDREFLDGKRNESAREEKRKETH